MPKDIKFNIKLTIDGKEQIVTAETNAKNFAQQLGNVKTHSDLVRNSMLKWNQITAATRDVYYSCQQLIGQMKEMTEAYDVQEEAEVKLSTVMRQRMGATDADVEGIKKLAGEQQKLGVIGDEVQLAGAQQVATFLTQKGSIEQLLPAMNNLLAQRKGLNVTSEDAVTVGNLMGKAMQGQTSALSRVGISFTDAQAKVMKYGSESERAGMLAQIITDNVGNMNSKLAETDSGKVKQMSNDFGDVKESIGKAFSAYMPFIEKFSEIGYSVSGVAIMISSLTSLSKAINFSKIATVSTVAAEKAAAAALYLYRNAAVAVTAATRILQAAFTGGSVGATTLKIAIRGLLISTGVGAAIAGVTMLIEYFADKSEKASESANQAAGSIDAVAEASKRANDAYNNTQSETYSNLMTKYKELQAAWKNLTDSQSKIAFVKNNQSAFANLGIRIRNASDAEYAFSKNTSAVVNSFLRRAKAAARLAQLTEEYRTQINLADRIQTANDAANARHHVNSGDVVKGSSHTTQGGYEEVGGDGNWHYTEKGAARENSKKWMANTSQDKSNRRALQQSKARTARLEKEAARDAEYNKPLSMPGPKTKARKKEKKDDKDKIIKDAKSYTALSHNLDVYKNRLAAVDPANKKLITSLNKQIDLTGKAAQAAKEAENGWDLQNPKSLEEVNAAIEKNQELRKKATAENIAGYDAENARLEELKGLIESSGHVEVPVDQIKTYKQLNDQLNFYQKKLELATVDARPEINKHIDEINKLKAAWDKANNAESEYKPKNISELNTGKDIDDAIQYYSDKQQTEDADNIEKTQGIINVLAAKKKALQRGMELPDMQNEATEINGLSGKEFKIKVRGIGVEELSSRIKDLQAQLNDVENPPTEGQRKEIKGLIQTYENWSAVATKSFDTYKSGWDSIKSTGDSIESITSALEGNGDAWQTVTGIIDGFIQLYEGISAIVTIINALTTATAAHTAAKTAEAVATGATATATGIDAAEQTAAAVAATPVIVANKLATASYLELASAAYFAAHAYIPFAGFGIAAGFTTAAVSMTEAVGVIPFANGGVVSGPTFALVGEYAGASNNPEVVAPLDKLRSMIQPQGGGGNFRFEVEGRKLVAVMANETRSNSRRTNIKL